MMLRLTTIVLAAVTFGAATLHSTLRTGPILVALGVLFIAAVSWPNPRLRELTLAVTVGISCLGSFGYALFATTVALGVLVVSEPGTKDSSHDASPVRRSLPTVVVLVGLLIAVSLGDHRIGPGGDTRAPAQAGTPDSSDNEPFDADVRLGDSTSEQHLTIEQVSADNGQYDAQRMAIEATLSDSADIRAEVTLGDQFDSGLQINGSETSGGMTDRLPWLLALIAFLIGGYSLVASRRFRHTPITTASTIEPSVSVRPLDWYDRIVAAAGHERHRADPVLSHSRRLADEIGDERFRELGRIVSDHVYSGRPLSDDDLELIRQLRRNDI